MIINSFLLALVMLLQWNWHPALVAMYCVIIEFISFLFWSSALLRVPHGAWFTVALSFILSTASLINWWGKSKKEDYIQQNKKGWSEVCSACCGPLLERRKDNALTTPRLPGIGVYYSEVADAVSPAVVHWLAHFGIAFEVVLIAAVRSLPVPYLQQGVFMVVSRLEGREAVQAYHVVVNCGYMETGKGEEMNDRFIDAIRAHLQTRAPSLRYTREILSVRNDLEVGLTRLSITEDDQLPEAPPTDLLISSELSALEMALERGVIHIVGNVKLHVKTHGTRGIVKWLKGMIINKAYSALHADGESVALGLSLPVDRVLQFLVQ